ncbi:MAG: hypothetical protein HKN43_12200 [Rhodothermales bacterium]|nr:hypothetical protein [Rhodothermales bacterium]
MRRDTKIFKRSNRIAGVAIIASLILFGAGSRATLAQTAFDALRFSERQPGSGVRSLGMGGVGAAGIADYSAVYTNPAGLGLFKKSTLSGSLGIYSITDDAIYTVGSNSTSLSNDQSDTRLGHIAYVHKYPTARGSLVMAIGINQVQSFSRELVYSGDNGDNSATDFFMPLPGEFEIDADSGQDGIFGTDDDVFFPSFSRPLSFIAFELFAIDFDADLYDSGDPIPFFPAVTTGTVRQTGSVTESGAMTEFNLAGAYEAAQDVFLGASVNIPYGKWDFDRFLSEEDLQNDNDGSGGTIDFEFLEWDQFVESELVGINARVGAVIRPDNGVRAGLSIESPTYYSITETFGTIMTVGFDDGYVDTYGDSVQEDVGAGEFEYEILTPWRFSGGVGFTTGDLTVMLDGEYVDWSTLELDSGTFSFTDENRFIRQNFESVVNVSAGLEYRFDSFRARLGVASKKDPVDLLPNQIDPELGTLNRDRSYFSAGVTYAPNSQFALDIAWSQERFDDRFLPYEVTGGPVVTEEIARNRFSVGARFSL